MHYQRLLKHGDALAPVEARTPVAGLLCVVDGCRRARRARVYCGKHYAQWRTKGFTRGRLKETRRRVEQKTGYVWLCMPGRTVLEHRYVMERKLGRPLRTDESVHHRNGQRDDNREDNLELWSRGQPAGQRVEDKLKWAREFIALYQPDPEWIGAGC